MQRSHTPEQACARAPLVPGSCRSACSASRPPTPTSRPLTSQKPHLGRAGKQVQNAALEHGRQQGPEIKAHACQAHAAVHAVLQHRGQPSPLVHARQVDRELLQVQRHPVRSPCVHGAARRLAVLLSSLGHQGWCGCVCISGFGSGCSGLKGLEQLWGSIGGRWHWVESPCVHGAAKGLAVLHGRLVRHGMLMFRIQGPRFKGSGRGSGNEVQHHPGFCPRMQWAARRLTVLHSMLMSQNAEV